VDLQGSPDVNISEAVDVQALVDFVTRLTMWEADLDPDAGSPLLGVVERLAQRSKDRLGAGMDGPTALAAARAAGIGAPRERT
jgi:hypothetical protein